MALCTTGSMSLGGSTSGRSVNCELGQSGTTCISMDETDVRDLAGISSGTISLSDFYGATSAPTTLGQSFEGGFYMGTIAAAGTTYYLLVAPNSTGCAYCQFKTSNTSTSGLTSRVDGYDNTYNSLTNSTHPAGNFTATRTIGGFSDWYLPAIDELQLFYDNGGGNGPGDPLPFGEDFKIGDASQNDNVLTWSSFETPNYSIGVCVFEFERGLQTRVAKTTGLDPAEEPEVYVRAVRRVPI